MRSCAVFLLSLLTIEYAYSQSSPEVLGSSDAIILDIAMIDDQGMVVAALPDMIQLWDYNTKSILNTWISPNTIAIEYSNGKLAGVSKSGELKIWNVPDGKELVVAKITGAPLTCVTWLDSVYVVAGSDDGEIVKVNAITGEIVSRKKTGSALTAVKGGPNNMILTGNAKGRLTTYMSANNFELKNEVSAHSSWIRDIQFSDSSAAFVTVGDDGKYKTWNLNKPDLAAKRRGLGNWVLCTDVTSAPNSDFDVMVFGKSNGEVVIVTPMATYNKKLKSVINSIGIIRGNSVITVIVGTHGGGLQLLSAKYMKFHKA